MGQWSLGVGLPQGFLVKSAFCAGESTVFSELLSCANPCNNPVRLGLLLLLQDENSRGSEKVSDLLEVAQQVSVEPRVELRYVQLPCLDCELRRDRKPLCHPSEVYTRCCGGIRTSSPLVSDSLAPPHLSVSPVVSQARYVQAKLSVHDRSLKVATVIESLEMEMELLCLTGVEDQLQADVRPTLETLRNAGIKVGGLLRSGR